MWKHQDLIHENYVAENYELLYYNTRFARHYYNDYARTVAKFIKKGFKVLEIGCGPATLTKRIKMCKPEAEYHCLDFSPKMLQIASSRCDNCTMADIEHLPYADQSFDLAFVQGALHHFPSFESIFSEVYRIIKPDSYFIIQEPSKMSFQRGTAMRYLEWLCYRWKIKRYPDLTYLEKPPNVEENRVSEHHGPIASERLISVLEKTKFAIQVSQHRYYSSAYFLMYDNFFVYTVSRLLDAHYVKKFNVGYLFFVILRKV